MLTLACILSFKGGWDTITGKMRENFSDEVDQAFANVDVNLKNAGGKGWSQVYRANIYVTDFGDEAIGHMVRNCKKWMPDHKPILTVVGVTKLGFEGMHFEIEVVAHDGDKEEEGGKASGSKK